MHDECKLLNEVRCLLLALLEAKIAVVERGEPVHEPKLDHEETVNLLDHLVVKLILCLSAVAIHSSHLSELEPILHVLERTLE